MSLYYKYCQASDGRYIVSNNTEVVAWFTHKQHAELFTSIMNQALSLNSIRRTGYLMWHHTLNLFNSVGMILPQPDKKSPTYDKEMQFYHNVQKALADYKTIWSEMSDLQKSKFYVYAETLLNSIINPARKHI